MRGKNLFLLFVMVVSAIVLDILVIFLMTKDEQVRLALIAFWDAPSVLIFTFLPLLVVNVEMVALPFLKTAAPAPIVIGTITTASVYFVLQLAVTLCLVLFHTAFVILSLLLLLFYILATGLIIYSAEKARNWGKNRQ